MTARMPNSMIYIYLRSCRFGKEAEADHEGDPDPRAVRPNQRRATLASAIREIYPSRTEIAASPTLGTRVIRLAAVALALPPAVMGGVRKRQHEVFHRHVAAYGADQGAVGEARDRALIREIMDLAAAAEAVRNHGAVDFAIVRDRGVRGQDRPLPARNAHAGRVFKIPDMSCDGTVPSKSAFKFTLSSGARSRSR